VSADCCDFGCNQGRDCPARTTPAEYPLSTGQSLKSTESPTEPDDMLMYLDTAEAALIWMIVATCTVICVYLIVFAAQFLKA